MVLKLLGVPLSRHADHKSEVSVSPCLNAGDRVLDDDRSSRLNPEQLCRCQERVRGGFPGQVLLLDHVPINLHVEEAIQPCGLSDGVAILTRGDDGDFVSLMAELTDEVYASLVGLLTLPHGLNPV